jgi:hypothetical protein
LDRWALQYGLKNRLQDITQYLITREGINMRRHYEREASYGGADAYWDEWEKVGAAGSENSDKSSNIIISGYVDALPPRPVKGDCYVIKEFGKRNPVFNGGISGHSCYEGIYYLNRKRSTEVDVSYVGDNDAEFDDGVIQTGLIELSDDRRLLIWGKSTYYLQAGLNDRIKVYYYNENKNKTGESGDLRDLIRITVPDGVKYIRVVYTLSNKIHRLKYLKVYQVNPKLKFGIVYQFDGTAWVQKTIPQGTVLPMKDGCYILKPFPAYGEQIYRPEINSQLPKIQMQSTLFLPDTDKKRWDYIQILNKREVLGKDYNVRIFVKKRFGKKKRKKSYYEIKNRRMRRASATSYLPQNNNAILAAASGRQTGNEPYLPYQWQALFFTVFCSVSEMIGNKDHIRDEWVASTGIKKRILTKDGVYYSSNRVDFAVCLSKKVKGKRVDGEMTFFTMFAGNKKPGSGLPMKVQVEVTG